MYKIMMKCSLTKQQPAIKQTSKQKKKSNHSAVKRFLVNGKLLYCALQRSVLHIFNIEWFMCCGCGS